MLDVSLQQVAFAYRDGFALQDVTFTVPRSSHAALVGPPACGATTLLRLIGGMIRPSSGTIMIGQRDVTKVKAANRPLLFVDSGLDVPARWSVQHALIAAVRRRSLDLVDRRHEFRLAADKWRLDSVMTRTIRTLSATETARLQLARIELLRPGILIADRLLEHVSASARLELADALYRSLRVAGTTVISAPSSRDELAFTDSIAVLAEGRIVQSGTAAEVFARPSHESSAMATGEVDLIPVVIHANVVESPIGSWEITDPPFQGSGVALVRPSDFTQALPGEESHLIFGVEEAGFTAGRWIARGLISGGVSLRIELPSETALHKGRLLALRYDASRFRLLARESATPETRVPTDVIPPMRETR